MIYKIDANEIQIVMTKYLCLTIYSIKNSETHILSVEANMNRYFHVKNIFYFLLGLYFHVKNIFYFLLGLYMTICCPGSVQFFSGQKVRGIIFYFCFA
jgi:hypothetical protein